MHTSYTHGPRFLYTRFSIHHFIQRHTSGSPSSDVYVYTLYTLYIVYAPLWEMAAGERSRVALPGPCPILSQILR